MGFNWGDALKGALGGGVAGAAFGGPMGAGIGSAAGGMLGGFGGWGGGGGAKPPTYNSHYDLPNYQQQYDKYGRVASDLSTRQAPTIAESSFRPDQQALVKMLQAQAAGRGPGQELVRMQAQQAADRAGAQQLAAAQGQVGGGAMAARGAAMGSASLQSHVGEQAAMGGLAAQLGATQQLGGVLQGARGQDLSRNSANAGLVMQNRELNQNGLLEALRQRLQASQMQQQGGLEYNRNLSNYNTGMIGQPSWGDRLMGFGVGAAQIGMMGRGMGSGSGGGAVTAQTPTNYGSNTLLNPFA
jgi:hypothetical protein